MALAVAIANYVGEWESTATSDFHTARLCGWIEYLNVVTLRVLAVFRIVLAGGMGRGSEVFPRTRCSRGPMQRSFVWVRFG